MTPIFSRSSLLALAGAMVVCLASMSATPASAEMRKIMMFRLGKFRPLFLPDLPVPQGWSVDKAACDATKLSVLVPIGSDFLSAKARIYGQALFEAEKMTVQNQAETSNRKWLAAATGRQIERLDDVARIKGGTAFEVFRYRDPKYRQQLTEIVAFGEDTDKEGGVYAVQIVLDMAGDQVIANDMAAFLTMLKNY